MPGLARIVVPGLPHHITQRGNRREAIFFEDGDHEVYRGLLAEQARKAGVEVWAYCLMPNQVHLILPPGDTADAHVSPRATFPNPTYRSKWSGREDLNLRPPGPEPHSRAC
jgi:REP element-mobilizing transposase RayT